MTEVRNDRRDEAKQWLRQRLTADERARQEWRALWAAAGDEWLDTPVDVLVDRAGTKRVADELAESDFLIDLLQPALHRLLHAAIEEARNDERALDTRVPSEVRARMRELVARPGLLHPDWVEAMLRGDAVEAVLGDTLYRVLTDFSTVIPRAMSKASVMGRFSVIGGAGALAERLIREVEKLIEPEIRAFLNDQMGRVLERMAGYASDRIDDPEQLEFRAGFVDFVLSRSPAFLLQGVDDDAIDELESLAEALARHIAQAPGTRDALHDGIDRVMTHCEGKSLREVLEWQAGADALPIDALADASWPAYVRWIGSEPATGWLDGLVDELFDEFASTGERSL